MNNIRNIFLSLTFRQRIPKDIITIYNIDTTMAHTISDVQNVWIFTFV